MRFLAALVAVLLLTGCSVTRKAPKSKFNGVKAQVAATFSTLESAAKKADKAKICAQVLSSTLVNSYGGAARCKGVVSNVLDDADPTGLSFKPQTITMGPGRRPTMATATVTSGSGKNADKGAVRLVKQRGGWRIDSFG